MELLTSNLLPAKFEFQTQEKTWFEFLKNSDKMKIATGYVSADSLIELKKIVEDNSKPHIEMLIGMHYFDKFTKPQYEAAIALNEVLYSKDLGAVYLSNARRFHGKMYSFIQGEKCIGAMIGSSNLSSLIGGKENLYEADCLFKDTDSALSIDLTISKLITQLGAKITDIEEIKDFNTRNSLLENHYDVKKLTPEELSRYLETKTSCFFMLPLKTKPKSNLNAFFGKGRVTQKGFITPRPWYEVEMIISKQVTSLVNFPYKKTFNVVTDDGWFFKCTTNGDFSKNFRSYDDLKILGKWIKGRMEQSGALKIGQPVTKEVLEKFGFSNLKLTATSNESIWILSFN